MPKGRSYKDSALERTRSLLAGSFDPLPPDKAAALYLEIADLMAFYQTRGWDWRLPVEYLIWKSRQTK